MTVSVIPDIASAGRLPGVIASEINSIGNLPTGFQGVLAAQLPQAQTANIAVEGGNNVATDLTQLLEDVLQAPEVFPPVATGSQVPAVEPPNASNRPRPVSLHTTEPVLRGELQNNHTPQLVPVPNGVVSLASTAGDDLHLDRSPLSNAALLNQSPGDLRLESLIRFTDQPDRFRSTNPELPVASKSLLTRQDFDLPAVPVGRSVRAEADIQNNPVETPKNTVAEINYQNTPSQSRSVHKPVNFELPSILNGETGGAKVPDPIPELPIHHLKQTVPDLQTGIQLVSTASAQPHSVSSLPNSAIPAISLEPVEVEIALKHDSNGIVTNKSVEAFSQEIAWLTGSGAQKARISLNPASLGAIDISIDSSGDNVSIQFVAQMSQTKELLESSILRLRDALQANGILLEDVDIRQESHSQQERQSAHTNSFPADSANRNGGAELPPATLVSSGYLLDATSSIDLFA